MSVTKEIAKLLHIDADTAERVRHGMDEAGIDYSECSVREFNSAARSAYDTLVAVQQDMAS